MLYLAKWKVNSPLLAKLGIGIFALIVFQIIIGLGLYYLGMPPVYQVFHLVGVAFLICGEFLLLLILREAATAN